MTSLVLLAGSAYAQPPAEPVFVPTATTCASVCLAAKLTPLNEEGKKQLNACGSLGHCSDGGLPLAAIPTREGIAAIIKDQTQALGVTKSIENSIKKGLPTPIPRIRF